jgi:hypothetical protein
MSSTCFKIDDSRTSLIFRYTLSTAFCILSTKFLIMLPFHNNTNIKPLVVMASACVKCNKTFCETLYLTESDERHNLDTGFCCQYFRFKFSKYNLGLGQPSDDGRVINVL